MRLDVIFDRAPAVTALLAVAGFVSLLPVAAGLGLPAAVGEDANREMHAGDTEPLFESPTERQKAVPVPGKDCRPHPPIRISGNQGPQGFVVAKEPATGKPIYRPGSGVTDGAGTAEDPYVIENLCIVPTPPNPGQGSLIWNVGIYIEDTSAHVVLRDVRVDAVEDRPFPIHPVRGIQLTDADNVNIEDSTVVGNGYGVYLRHSHGATVANTTVVDNDAGGLTLRYSNNAVITGNNLSGNGWDGLRLTGSDNPVIINNTVERNGGDGVFFLWSPGARIEGNEVHGNADGIHPRHSDASLLRGNIVTDNQGKSVYLRGAKGATLEDNELESGIVVDGWSVDEFQHTIDPSNTVDGEPVRYIRDKANASVPDPASQVILANTTGVTVSGHNLSGVHTGIQLAFTSETTIENSTITDNEWIGADLFRTVETLVENSTIARNDGRKGAGIDITDSENVTIRDNAITENDGLRGAGVAASGATNLFLQGNNVAGNDDDGLDLLKSSADARENWWGSDRGPSGDLIDDCTGTEANLYSDGDWIDKDEASTLCFDPWLESPNPNAGPE